MMEVKRVFLVATKVLVSAEVHTDDPFRALLSLPWMEYEEALTDIDFPTQKQYVDEANRTMHRLARSLVHKVTAPPVDLPISFDMTDPRAIAWAKANAGKLVTDLSKNSQKALQTLIEQAMSRGIARDELIDAIKAVVGLNQRQGQALMNYMKGLDEAGIDKVKKEVLVTAYRDRLLTQRADVIARNEILTAANEGRWEAWHEAGNMGLFDTEAAGKEWSAAPDACDDCDLNDGEVVGLDEDFPSGDQMPPLHIDCRCTASLVVDGVNIDGEEIEE